jgi:hypothetical protein
MFLPAGAKAPMFLGDGAAAVVEFIHNMFKVKGQETDQAAMEKSITEKVTKEITGKVTAELMKKFKASAKDGSSFKSLGDAPGSMDITKDRFSEKDFAKMSEEEQRIALGG